MTKLAAQYAVGGRIVTAEQTTASTLAELLPIPSPFAQQVLPTPPQASEKVDLDKAVLQWLQSAEALQPDIVLLDYASRDVVKAQNEIIARLAASALMVAAAGNEGPGKQVEYPARMADVLAVGALTSDDTVADYSSLAPARGKPELHARGMLRGTPLESAITEPEAFGTSFAALLVTAAAALAWSINPARDHLWLRGVLLDSAKTIRLKRTSVRGLDIEKALTLARASAVLDPLGSGEVAYAELQGGVGFSAAVLDPVLQYLLDQNKIRVREDLGVRLYRAVEPSQPTAAPSPAATSPIPPSAPQPQPPSSQPLPPSPPRAKPKRASSRPRAGTNRPRGR